MIINGVDVDPRIDPRDRDHVYGKPPAKLYHPDIPGCSSGDCIFQDNSGGAQTNGGCACSKELARTVEGRKAIREIHWLRHQYQASHEELRQLFDAYRLGELNSRRDGF